MAYRAIYTLIFLSTAARAWVAPAYSGFTKVFEDAFIGSQASLPNTDRWNAVDGDLGINNELQVYTSSNRNVQLSGGDSLQLTPRRDSSQDKGWTSGRIESKYVFTPSDGKVTRVEAVIRFGSNPASAKKGIWPAWWMLGDVIRNGGSWPSCGEIDILETVNGDLTGHGTVHCDVYPGGICNEGSGIGSSVDMPDQSWHTWRVEIDRTSSNYLSQSINWYMDGTRYHQVTGTRIGDEEVWASLAQRDLFMILNVAVGGDWVCTAYDLGASQCAVS